MRISRKRFIVPVSFILTAVLFVLLYISMGRIQDSTINGFGKNIIKDENNSENTIIKENQTNNTNSINNSNSTNNQESNKYDYINSKLENSLSNIALKAISYPIDPTNFVSLREYVELHTELWRDIFGEGPYTSEELQDSTFLIQDVKQLNGKKKLLAALHQKLYPWIYKRRFYSPKSIFRSFSGRGIVICAGDYHFKYARSSIDTLRYVLNTTLPIEIFYNGEEDLNYENRRILTEYENVYLSDITKYFDNGPLEIGGWAIKPFAVLASRFQEVILMDADSMYIRDPSELFDDEGYISTGTVFFKDRTLFPGPSSSNEWLKSWMVDPLPETKNLRYWNELTSHEMESSTVVIDKSRAILGLLAVCKFNEKRMRDDVVYKKVHGDKETFWMAFDMARQHYNEISLPAAIVGELHYGAEGDDPKAKQICGHVGHVDSKGRVLFWNDHIVKDKNDDRFNDRLLHPEVYVVSDKEMEWPTFHCGDLGDLELKKFDNEELEVINEIMQRELQHNYIVSGEHEDEYEKEKAEELARIQ